MPRVPKAVVVLLPLFGSNFFVLVGLVDGKKVVVEAGYHLVAHCPDPRPGAFVKHGVHFPHFLGGLAPDLDQLSTGFCSGDHGPQLLGKPNVLRGQAHGAGRQRRRGVHWGMLCTCSHPQVLWRLRSVPEMYPVAPVGLPLAVVAQMVGVTPLKTLNNVVFPLLVKQLQLPEVPVIFVFREAGHTHQDGYGNGLADRLREHPHGPSGLLGVHLPGFGGRDHPQGVYVGEVHPCAVRTPVRNDYERGVE